MVSDREALQHHREHGCCEDHRRKNVICTVAGGECNNCGGDYVYCSENNVIKESCDCNGNAGKWAITPWLADELDIDADPIASWCV